MVLRRVCLICRKTVSSRQRRVLLRTEDTGHGSFIATCHWACFARAWSEGAIDHPILHHTVPAALAPSPGYERAIDAIVAEADRLNAEEAAQR